MVYNALAGACTGIALGLTLREIKAGIESLRTIAGRSNLIETESLMIIDDCYNASPVSMQGSLDVLSYSLGRTVAVMGDMFELGAKERELHWNAGVYASRKGIDVICCIGKLSHNTWEGASAQRRIQGNKNAAYYFETKEDFLDKLPNIIRKGDTVMVKASHSMEFPEIVERLKEF